MKRLPCLSQAIVEEETQKKVNFGRGRAQACGGDGFG